MLGLEPEIKAEYERVTKDVRDLDVRTSEASLTLGEVLKAHFLIANHFYLEGSGLGGIGPRDMGLLQSAIYRQVSAFGGQSKYTDQYDICATLFFGLIKNHAFHDANKRTAFLSALFQLHRMGRCPSVREEDFEDFAVDVADSALDKYVRYRDMLKSFGPDATVKFISWYLKKNTRDVERKHHDITYQQLNTILSRFGFFLENPHGNHINIVKRERKRTYLGFGPEKEVTVRVGQIGFPRWTAQVGKGAIKTVREVTGLVAEKGIDSASFYRGVDTIQSLISTYHQPLVRLAQR